MALFKFRKSKSPYFRLATLCFTLVLVWSGREYLGLYSGSRKEQVNPQQVHYIPSDPDTVGGDPFSEVVPQKQLYPTVNDDIRNIEYKRKPGSLNDLGDAVGKISSWVASFDTSELSQKAVSRSYWHYENIMREPEYWRFSVMHVYGLLADKSIIDYPDNPPGLRKLYMLTLYDQNDGNFFTVLTPLLEQDTQEHVDSVGGTKGVNGSNLAFDGIFLLNFPYITGNSLTETPLFFAPKVWKAREGRTAPPLLDGSVYGNNEQLPQTFKPTFALIPGIDLKYIKSKIYNPPKSGDQNPFYQSMAADLRSEKPVLLHLFQYLYSMPPQDARKRSNNPEINYVSIMQGNNAPEWMTGRFTGVKGVALSLETLHFSGATDGVDKIHLLTAGDLGYTDIGSFTWVLATLQLPAGLRQGDRVRADGIFLKLFPYTTRDKKWHWAPLLVCRSVTRLPQPLSPLAPEWLTSDNVIWLFAFSGCAILLVFLLMYLSSARDTRVLNKILRRTRINGVSKKLGMRFIGDKKNRKKTPAKYDSDKRQPE